jgi:hypothetical protein
VLLLAAPSCAVLQLRARLVHMSAAWLVLLVWWSSCGEASAASWRQQ